MSNIKSKKTIIVGLIVIIIIAISIVIAITLRQKSDAITFKKEYESLNNTVRESDGATYNNIDIPNDNPIKYITPKEAVDIINNQTGVIYFGANWCPWCRNAVPVLFESAKENNIDTIYYVNMDKVRNIWEVQDQKLVKVQKEQDGYYQLLESLDSVLEQDTYTLTDDDGNTYDTKEKRIYMPMVITVKNGNIIDHHVGTVTLNENQTKYDDLTKDQHQELLTTYNNMLKKLNDGEVCNDNQGCD